MDGSPDHDRLVISGGLALTGSPLTGGLQAADLSVVAGRIAEIGPDLPADGAQVIDAHGTFLLPGFVDTHQHLWQTAMRGITAGWDLTDFLWGIRQNHAGLFQLDDLYAGTYAGGLASLAAGTTTTIEYAYSLNTPEHADAAIAAIRQTGIRAVWCYGLIDVPLERPYFDRPQRRWPEVRRVRSEHFASNRCDELVTMGLGVNDLFTYPWEVTRGEYALARELDLLLTSHINSVWQPGAAPEIEWLHRDGLLGPDQVCVHATTSSDHELRLLADAGASVASTPETELQMGLGFRFFARAAALGVNAGLGADIQANNSPDAFVRMRLGMRAENLRADLPLLEGAGVSALHGVSAGPREILYHATLGGAQALSGKTVLIAGAGGGVGSFATQFAVTAAHVIANVRAAAAGRMRGYGAAETIDHTQVSLPDAVRQAHPGGIDVLIDLVSDAAGFAALAALLRPGGTAVTTKYVADPGGLATAQITGINFSFSQYVSSELLERVAGAVVTGRIVAPPITRITLEQAPAALNPRQAGRADSKTVITL